MKKQFFRVKQLADQAFLRADKSAVLNNDELCLADQRIEYLKTSITAINKKIVACQGADAEKRAKKSPEYQIGSVFLEQCQKRKEVDQTNIRSEDECQLFPQILGEAGDVLLELASDYANHEFELDKLVIAEFQKVLDVEFPNIYKQKRSLSKYLLDLDSATHRYQATKKETIKDDMEEADTKVEQSRDALATEMFNLLSRENEFSSYILQLLKIQRAYHESAFKTLERVIPDLEKKIGDSSVKKVFGVSLKEHLRVTKAKLAYPLQICITLLSHIGMSEEGLLRIAGGSSKVKRLKSCIDSGCFSSCVAGEYRDVHVIASTLKLYLRELPEPLLTFFLHDNWIECMNCDNKLEVVKSLLNKLPQQNLDNLTYLIQFLARLSQNQDDNKMSSSNIAIVMAPNLLWKLDDADITNYVSLNMLVDFFIREVDELFPNDVSRYVTFSPLFQEEEEKLTMSYNALNNMNSEGVMSSPKPIIRKKKPAAPVPPSTVSKTDQDVLVNSKSSPKNSYPSGSVTLMRPNKPKDPGVPKTSIGINTCENSLSLSQEKVSENIQSTHNKAIDSAKVSALVSQLDDKKVTELKCGAQPSSQVLKPKPVQTATAQNQECDKDQSYTTTVVHQVGNPKTEDNQGSKPVAAPRSIINVDSNSLRRNCSLRNESVSKSLGEAFGEVQLRRSEPFDRQNKPIVPVRPSSLQRKIPTELSLDGNVQKTQCIFSNVASKQQPSFVNVQNRADKFLPGHDNLIAEKERFLYNQPEKAVVPLPRTSLENKFSDVNSNCPSSQSNTVPECLEEVCRRPRRSITKSSEQLYKSQEKLNVTKSTEKLSEPNENSNKKTSHNRTQSDGNIIGISGDTALRSVPNTPTSPRTLNKPTEPPPPPPVGKTRQPESTDL